MKQQKTIEKRIFRLERLLSKFENDKTLSISLVKTAVKRIKKEIKILKWVLN